MKKQDIAWHERIKSLEGWYFGGKGSDYCDKLLALVVKGRKTATCMWEEAARAESVTIPKVGDLSYIMNSSGKPVVVIETIEIELKAFLEVDDQFARDEGEGDLSYEHWKKVHEECFHEEGKKIGLIWDSELAKVYCERFKVIHIFE
jgi:uncharacterized protein YhfF